MAKDKVSVDYLAVHRLKSIPPEKPVLYGRIIGTILDNIRQEINEGGGKCLKL